MRAIRTALIQQASGFHTRLLDISAERHEAYAARHNLTFWSVRGDVQSERPPHWNKVLLILDALHFGFDLVVWLDADALLCRVDQDLRQALPTRRPIAMCRHPLPWGRQSWHYNTGVVVIRNTPLSSMFLETLWKAGPVSHPWQEQIRFNELSRTFPDAIQRLDDKWNSTDEVNAARNPIIRAWHGRGRAALGLMKSALKSLKPGNPRTIERTARQRDRSRMPLLKSPRLAASFAALTTNIFDYHRIGYDRRPMSFLSDGYVGVGAADSELFWRLASKNGASVLEIYSERELTCALTEHADGVWRGKWRVFERMPIELAPGSASSPDAAPLRLPNSARVNDGGPG
ncbi:MAG TPA: hypothetical protein VLU94_01200 [Candidatus Nitrosotalea sp.]|nr:hypothetical protein [Candidatus Nitrosotalea sp.]